MLVVSERVYFLLTIMFIILKAAMRNTTFPDMRYKKPMGKSSIIIPVIREKTCSEILQEKQMTAVSLQQELDKLDNWCEEHNGKLHPDKASVLWCSLNNMSVHDQMPDVSIAGQNIKRDQILRYLGIIFDRALSGKDHVSRVI